MWRRVVSFIESGFASWWSNDVKASSAVGAVTQFRFGNNGFNDMKVVEMAPGKHPGLPYAAMRTTVRPFTRPAMKSLKQFGSASNSMMRVMSAR